MKNWKSVAPPKLNGLISRLKKLKTKGFLHFVDNNNAFCIRLYEISVCANTSAGFGLNATTTQMTDVRGSCSRNLKNMKNFIYNNNLSINGSSFYEPAVSAIAHFSPQK